MRKLAFFLCAGFAVSPLNGAFAGTTIPLTVNLSESVTVTGTPRVAVDVGGQTRYATYTSGSGTSTLTFTLSPQTGDVDLDGIAVSAPIDLNGGTMKDAAGNDLASLTFIPPNTSGIKVNYPSLGMDFVYDADGRYSLNGAVYNDLTSFLAASGGSFTRSSVGTYFDSTGTLQTAATGVPRFDWDPVTHAAKGILIEETRTNQILNSGMIGGTTGSPGVLPTGWRTAGSVFTPLSRSLSYGIENGIPYMDISLSGVPTNLSHGYYFTDTITVPAIIGQLWTTSFYAKLLSGDPTQNVTMKVNITGRDSSGTQVEGSSTSFIPNSNWTRYSSTRTMNSSQTVYVAGAITFTWVVGQPVDFSIRLMAPQLEQGAFPTSYIPTTTAAVTRAADVLSIPTGGWFNSAEGTLLAQAASYPASSVVSGGNSPSIASISGSGSILSARLGRRSVTNAGYFQAANALLLINTEVWPQGVEQKISGSYGTSGFSAILSGNSIYTGAPLTLGSGNTSLDVGHYKNTGFWSSTISKIKYYPLRVSDAQLQLLTQ